MSLDLIRTQNPIGGGFLVDPFLEINSGVTTPAIQKSNKSDSSCLTNGALAGSIIGTLIMSAFIGFLTWLIYLRPKLKELHYKHLNENRKITDVQHHLTIPPCSSSISNKRQQIDDHVNQLPLDVTDYKFGTFPFRQSQVSSVNGHYHRTDWLNRISSSFRSVNMDQDSEMIDVELLDPTFGGLNFSITGNMRAGIFVKEILQGQKLKINSSNQLKTGDRIVALTVCFESIVYEDALTILSYASPYPVILRVQRPTNHTKVSLVTEKRSTITNTTNKVKWRDDFEHYDNDTPLSRSFAQSNLPPTTTTNPLPPIPTNSKTSSSSKKIRSNSNTQPRINNKSSSGNKGNKIKTSSNSILATSGATTKRCNNDIKKHRSKTNNNQNPMIVMSTGLTSKPSTKITTPPMSTNKTTMKSVTNAVISYLHYKDSGGGVEHPKDVANNSETTMMPYYDSPYDYYYGGQVSQYQYLHQSHLNKNNNNSLSTESLTAVTPNLTTSIYTLKFSSIKPHILNQRRCKRRFSSPPIIITEKIVNENLIDNTDTFV